VTSLHVGLVIAIFGMGIFFNIYAEAGTGFAGHVAATHSD
jgi:hypothetical protein